MAGNFSLFLFYTDHVVVYRLTALDVADLHAGAALGLNQLGGALGLLIGDVGARDDGDELAVLLFHGTSQTVGHLGDVGAGGNDFAVFQQFFELLFAIFQQFYFGNLPFSNNFEC